MRNALYRHLLTYPHYLLPQLHSGSSCGLIPPSLPVLTVQNLLTTFKPDQVFETLHHWHSRPVCRSQLRITILNIEMAEYHSRRISRTTKRPVADIHCAIRGCESSRNGPVQRRHGSCRSISSVFRAPCSMLTGRRTSLYRVSRCGCSRWVLARRIWPVFETNRGGNGSWNERDSW